MDAFGEASVRVEQKTRSVNGQMNDTASIMRVAAEAARAAEERNNRLLAALQREIDLFGANRAEIERYNAAMAGMSASTQRQAAALGAKIDAMRRDEQAARDLSSTSEKAAQAGDRFIKNLHDQVATLGMTTQQLQLYRAAQLGVSDAAAPLIAKLGEAGAGAHATGKHMEGLNFQTVGARRELLVLAHELSQGNYQKFGGSMMVLGEQTGAAGLLFSAAGIAALGLAAAVGTTVYAMIKGASEQKQMNNALIATGNYAGVTAAQLNEMAHAAVEAGGSIGEAKKAVIELAASGKFTGDQVAYITSAVIAFEHATGTSIEKTIKQFEALAVQTTGSSARATEAISRAAVKQDDTYHFLTESVYEHIRALEKEGDAKGASALATETLARVLEDRSHEMLANIGGIARAWNAVKEAIGGAVDAMSKAGAKVTPSSDVKNISFRLQQFDEGLAGSNQRLGRAPDAMSAGTEAARTAIVLELVTAVDKLNKADAAAIAQGNKTLAESEAVHAASRIAMDDQKLQKKGLSELTIAMDAYHDDIKKIKAVNPDSILVTPAAIAAHEAALAKAHTQTVQKPHVDQAENTRMASDLKRIEEVVATEKSATEYLMKLDDMRHKAGEIGDAEFYGSRRGYAAELAGFEIEGYDKQLVELRKHHAMTGAEVEKNAKAILDVLGKKKAAADRFAYDELIRDEEARIRMDAGAKAADAAAVKEIATINAQVAALEMQIRTYNMLPAAKTGVLIADLEVEKSTRIAFDNDAKAISLINAKIDGLKRLAAAQGIATKQDTGSDVAKAKELLDILTAVDAATKSAASSMAESFGRVGSAIGGLTTALSGYAVQQQAIAAQLAATKADPKNSADKIASAEIAASHASAQAQIKSYGDMAGAAKGFFKENSTGYRALEGAEKAYRAFEMAMAVQSMLTKSGLLTAFTGLFVTAKATETAATVASVGPDIAASTAKGMAAAAAGVAGQAQGDPYTAWVRMAAMAAAMAALGFAVSGGGGSGDTTAKDRQAAAGTGSILGDSTAKSDSIARALELTSANSSIELTHTAAMVASLHNIENNISGLANLLIRTTGISGATAADTRSFSSKSISMAGAAGGAIGGAALGTYLGMGFAAIGGPLGLALGAVIGGVLGGTFIGKALSSVFGGSTSVTDTGLSVASASVGAIASNGVRANQYTDTKTDGGWFSSDKHNTSLRALGSEIDDQFGKVILGIGDSVKQAATILGVGGDDFTARLNGFVVDLGKVSLKGLNGDQIQKQLETTFAKLGDDMAQFGVGGLQQFQKVGEGYFETLSRIATDYANLDSILASTGSTFGATSLSSIAARERLIELTGGIDKLASKSSSFADDFLTEAERLAPVRKYVAEQLSAMGMASITTRDQFKATVLGLASSGALATEAGAKQYAALLDLEAAFAKTHAATEDLTKSEQGMADERKDLQTQLNELTMTQVQLLAKQRAAIADVNKPLWDQVQAMKKVASAKDVLSSAYDKESATLKTTADRMKAFQASTLAFADSLKLGSLSTLMPAQKAAEAQRQYEATLGKAKAGDAAAQSALQAAATAYLTADQVIKASSNGYAADAAKVQADLAALAAIAGGQATDAEKQLVALDKQVGALIDINASIKDGALTVAQAIASLARLGYTGTSGLDGSHANGLSYVPFDGYRAELHKGERVLTSSENINYQRMGTSNMAPLVAEIRGLREDNKGLREDNKRLIERIDAQTDAFVASTYDATDRAANKQVDGAKAAAMVPVYAKRMEGKLE